MSVFRPPSIVMPPHPRRSVPPGDRTVAHLFAAQVAATPDRVLLKIDDEQVTYRAFADRVNRVRRILDDWEIGPGERVLTATTNRAEPLELLLACAFSGSLFVPLNPHLRAEQLRHQVRDAEPALVIVEREFAPEVQAALLDVGSDARVVVLEAGHWATRESHPFRDSEGRVLVPNHRPQDPLAVLYTSGTTGPSKGVLCPQGQFFWWAIYVGEYLELTSGDVLYTVLPLYHVNALSAFLQAIAVGASFGLGKRFSASRFVEDLQRHDATVTYLLGAMVTILYKQPPSEHDREHRVRIALSPATPPHLWQAFEERFGFRLLEGFGMTELNLVICAPPTEQRPGDMGRPIDGFLIEVVDEDDHPVPIGVAGELVVRPTVPHSIALGYWRNAEATVEAWRNLWFHTGDRVVRTEDGTIRFVDRKKDAIRRRGENISSFEVESALALHPSVAEVACFGVPSELGEEEVMVCVVPDKGVDIDERSLLEWAGQQLAYFAVPRFVRVVKELPRTANGKIIKQRLRDEGVTADTFDVDSESPERR